MSLSKAELEKIHNAIKEDTLNLVTKLDSTGKTWTITGQVENRVTKVQRNVQITAYFYDSKGNSIGGPYKGAPHSNVLVQNFKTLFLSDCFAFLNFNGIMLLY
jgi:phosphoserine phosphatase